MLPQEFTRISKDFSRTLEALNKALCFFSPRIEQNLSVGFLVGLVFLLCFSFGRLFFCLKAILNSQSSLGKRFEGSEIWKSFSGTKLAHTSNYKSTMYNFFYLSVKYSSFSMVTQEIAAISNILLN